MTKLILKQKPDDFYVEEILPKDYFENVNSTIYLYKIEKRNLSHKELENILKTKFKKQFYFCGMKDKNAITIQYITSHEFIENFELNENDYNLKLNFMNRTKKHLFTGANTENYFKIKTNKFKDIKIIQYIGAINYFDEQRFGNSEYINLTLSVLKNDFENALKIYLTRKSFNNEINAEREELLNNWNDLTKLNNDIVKKIFEVNEYKKEIYNLIIKKDFEKAFNLLNKKDLQFYYKQFQSYLWNELLKKIVSKYNYKEYDNLYFPLEKIPHLELDLPNSEVKYKQYKTEFDNVLKENNIKQKDLITILPKIKEKRYTTFFPKNIKQTEYIEFYIPKGCYATIVIKQLYCSSYV